MLHRLLASGHDPAGIRATFAHAGGYARPDQQSDHADTAVQGAARA